MYGVSSQRLKKKLKAVIQEQTVKCLLTTALSLCSEGAEKAKAIWADRENGSVEELKVG